MRKWCRFNIGTAGVFWQAMLESQVEGVGGLLLALRNTTGKKLPNENESLYQI